MHALTSPFPLTVSTEMSDELAVRASREKCLAILSVGGSKAALRGGFMTGLPPSARHDARSERVELRLRRCHSSLGVELRSIVGTTGAVGAVKQPA